MNIRRIEKVPIDEQGRLALPVHIREKLQKGQVLQLFVKQPEVGTLALSEEFTFLLKLSWPPQVRRKAIAKQMSTPSRDTPAIPVQEPLVEFEDSLPKITGVEPVVDVVEAVRQMRGA